MGNNIRQCRKNMGMTQEDLAEMVGCRRETIANLEKGKYNPSFELVDAIAVTLDVTIYELMECRSQIIQNMRNDDLVDSTRDKVIAAMGKFSEVYGNDF